MHTYNNINFNYPNLRKLEKKINSNADILFNELMNKHTSFKIGGPAVIFVSPYNIDTLIECYTYCITNKIPYFILGGGSNILVSDRGINGIVLHTGHISGFSIDDNVLTALSGTTMSELAEETAKTGLSGIENFYYMPGTAGGAVWINARCYGVSISDSLLFVDVLDKNLERKRIHIKKEDFAYKKSPFQASESLILKAGFKLDKKDPGSLLKKIPEYKEDRFNKGHFDLPCAGSVFKNNRNFGRSSGKIIDELGLKGYSAGKAKVLEKHGNIIVNTGGAKAEEVIELIELIKYKVKEKYNFELEEEIIRVGNFS